MKIETIADLKNALRHAYSPWPGGYPRFFLTNDNGALCFDAVLANLRECFQAIKDNDNSGWRIIAVAINYEDAQLYCAHTNARIESAYAEEDDAMDEFEIPENAELLFDSSSGVYIPQRFATEIRRECVEGVTDWQWEAIEHPDNEYYWDAWNSIIDNAVLTDGEKRFTLYQDGDVWMLPN